MLIFAGCDSPIESNNNNPRLIITVGTSSCDIRMIVNNTVDISTVDGFKITFITDDSVKVIDSFKIDTIPTNVAGDSIQSLLIRYYQYMRLPISKPVQVSIEGKSWGVVTETFYIPYPPHFISAIPNKLEPGNLPEKLVVKISPQNIPGVEEKIMLSGDSPDGNIIRDHKYCKDSITTFIMKDSPLNLYDTILEPTLFFSAETRIAIPKFRERSVIIGKASGELIYLK